MKPKSCITLTPGFIFMIIKHPKEWVQQNFKLEDDVTLHNETNNILYFTLKDSLLSDEEKNEKLYVAVIYKKNCSIIKYKLINLWKKNL